MVKSFEVTSSLSFQSRTNLACSTACYLATQDKACRADNTNGPSDMIFYNRECRTVDYICSTETNGLMTGLNVSFCSQLVDNAAVPINQVITRILASEEYFK